MFTISKLLKRFGYIHESEITDEYTIERFKNSIGNPTEIVLSKELDKEFFEALEKIDGGREYFKATAAKDMVRFFGSQDATEQAFIRGAFARTIYFFNRMKKIKEPETQTKIKNLRYSR